MSEGIDRSTHPTIVEYGVQEMFKNKSVKAAARSTAKKHSGYENMFFGPGVTLIDPAVLEDALWDRLADFTIKRIPNMKQGKEHYALEGTLQHFKQKQSALPVLKARVVAKLGHDPFVGSEINPALQSTSAHIKQIAARLAAGG